MPITFGTLLDTWDEEGFICEHWLLSYEDDTSFLVEFNISGSRYTT